MFLRILSLKALYTQHNMTGPDIELLSNIDFNTHIQIRDPMAKNDISYDIPSSKIIPTAALKNKNHRSCLCILYLKGRCGQGSKCKSYHVEKELISDLRTEFGVEINENFITEVVVFDIIESKQLIFAVRFPAVMRTKGLDDYRRDFSNGRISPMKLCNVVDCDHGEECKSIHIKETEQRSLKTKTLRTPCCEQHGDRHHIRLGAAIQTHPTGIPLVIPSNLLAWNEAARRIAKGHMFTIRDVCKPHITGRCKYGKSCGHLHVCRVWWEKQSEIPKPTLAQRAESVESVTPTSTPSVTPPRSPHQHSFIPDYCFSPVGVEESFGLPFWNENLPPELGNM